MLHFLHQILDVVLACRGIFIALAVVAGWAIGLSNVFSSKFAAISFSLFGLAAFVALVIRAMDAASAAGLGWDFEGAILRLLALTAFAVVADCALFFVLWRSGIPWFSKGAVTHG